MNIQPTRPTLPRRQVPAAAAAAAGGRASNAGTNRNYVDGPAAERGFAAARANLLDVNNWKRVAGGGPLDSGFKLHGPDGKPKQGPPKEGDFIQISVGPGQVDWVQIETIRDDPAKVEIVVRPSRDPQRPNDPAIKHFFTAEATNTFTVERKGNSVYTSVRGLNERDNASGGLGGLRNWAVNAGSRAGAQQAQWDHFTAGLLRNGYARDR